MEENYSIILVYLIFLYNKEIIKDLTNTLVKHHLKLILEKNDRNFNESDGKIINQLENEINFSQIKHFNNEIDKNLINNFFIKNRIFINFFDFTKLEIKYRLKKLNINEGEIIDLDFCVKWVVHYHITKIFLKSFKLGVTSYKEVGNANILLQQDYLQQVNTCIINCSEKYLMFIYKNYLILDPKEDVSWLELNCNYSLKKYLKNWCINTKNEFTEIKNVNKFITDQFHFLIKLIFNLLFYLNKTINLYKIIGEKKLIELKKLEKNNSFKTPYYYIFSNKNWILFLNKNQENNNSSYFPKNFVPLLYTPSLKKFKQNNANPKFLFEKKNPAILPLINRLGNQPFCFNYERWEFFKKINNEIFQNYGLFYYIDNEILENILFSKKTEILFILKKIKNELPSRRDKLSHLLQKDNIDLILNQYFRKNIQIILESFCFDDFDDITLKNPLFSKNFEKYPKILKNLIEKLDSEEENIEYITNSINNLLKNNNEGSNILKKLNLVLLQHPNLTKETMYSLKLFSIILSKFLLCQSIENSTKIFKKNEEFFNYIYFSIFCDFRGRFYTHNPETSYMGTFFFRPHFCLKPINHLKILGTFIENKHLLKNKNHQLWYYKFNFNFKELFDLFNEWGLVDMDIFSSFTEFNSFSYLEYFLENMDEVKPDCKNFKKFCFYIQIFWLINALVKIFVGSNNYNTIVVDFKNFIENNPELIKFLKNPRHFDHNLWLKFWKLFGENFIFFVNYFLDLREILLNPHILLNSIDYKDSTANVLTQLGSILRANPKLLKQLNVIQDNKWNDPYSYFTNFYCEYLENHTDIKNILENNFIHLNSLICRKTLKKLIMTYFYGSTPITWKTYFIAAVEHNPIWENLKDETQKKLIKILLSTFPKAIVDCFGLDLIKLKKKILTNKNASSLEWCLSNKYYISGKYFLSKHARIPVKNEDFSYNFSYVKFSENVDRKKENIAFIANLSHSYEAAVLKEFLENCSFDIVPLHDCIGSYFIFQDLVKINYNEAFYKTHLLNNIGTIFNIELGKEFWENHKFWEENPSYFLKNDYNLI